LQRNNGAARDGHFVAASLTKQAAASMKRDATFAGTFTGNVYASPLFVANGPGGKGIVVIADESNNVRAFDERSGAAVWTRTIGPNAAKSGAGCGNIGPIGITGTPAIDLGSRTLFANAAIGTAANGSGTIKTHEIHALSIDDGSERPGFPIDVSKLSSGGINFNPPVQNQRSSVLVTGGMAYVTYGGHYGDCGDYHGWIVGFSIGDASTAKAWATQATAAGMWSPGGPASDGTSVFITTGNATGSNGWQGQEALLRFQPGPVFSGQAGDYFYPSDWKTLDSGDIDIGGSGPVVVDVPGATPSALAVVQGKNGVVYLVDRGNLGGAGHGNGTTGEALASAKIFGGEIINVAAAYTTASGTYVVMRGNDAAAGVACPTGQSGDLVAVKIGATSPPTLTTAWCQDNHGAGSPIVSTTDAQSNAIVWSAGAEQNPARLHGWDGDTGQPIFTGGGANDGMTAVRRFTSPIVANGAIYVAGDNHLYKFITP
jgi:hypothetical protein